MSKFYILFILNLFLQSAFADKPKAALRFLEKGEYDKAAKLLDKSLERDSLNPSAYYVYSLLYTDTNNAIASLDTAYLLLQTAKRQFDSLSKPQLEEFIDEGFRYRQLLQHGVALEKLAFQEIQPTVASYNAYISLFTNSDYLQSAIKSRDSLLFLKLQHENDIGDYFSFLSKYPNSFYHRKAAIRLDSIIYSTYSFESKPASYYEFLEKYPKSIFREKVIERIAFHECRNGKKKSMEHFLAQFPNSDVSPRIREQMRLLYGRYSSWFPVINTETRKYTFISTDGETLSRTGFTFIDDHFLTSISHYPLVYGKLHEKLVIVNHRNEIIYDDFADACSLIEGGFAYIQSRGSFALINFNGDTLGTDELIGVELIEGRYLRLKNSDGLFGLCSLWGEMLIPMQYHDIALLGNHWMLTKEDLSSIISEHTFLNTSNPFSALHFVEEIELLPSGAYLLYNGDQQQLLSKYLDTVVAFGQHDLYPFSDGLIIKKEDHDELSLQWSTETIFAKSIDLFYDQWIVIKNDSYTIKENIEGGRTLVQYDSAHVISADFIYLRKHGKTEVYFSQRDSLIEIDSTSQISVLKNGSTSGNNQLLVRGKDIFSVYDINGKLLIETRLPISRSLNEALWLVDEGKKGAVDSSGTLILPQHYDGIFTLKNNLLQTVQDERIQLYNLKTKAFLPYELGRSVDFISADYAVISEESQHGLIRPNGKIFLKPEFDAIEHWNADKVLVKDSLHWSIFDIHHRDHVLNKILKYEDILQDDVNPKVKKIFTSDGLGIIHNHIGIVVPPAYDEVINLGTGQDPFYLAYLETEDGTYHVKWLSGCGDIVYQSVLKEGDFLKIFPE